MGFILDNERGIFSAESRREGFKIHFETFDPRPPHEYMKGMDHPEFLWEDLDDLAGIVLDLSRYAQERGIRTTRRQSPEGEGSDE